MFVKAFDSIAFSVKNIRRYPLGYIGVFAATLFSVFAFLYGIIMYDNQVLYDESRIKNEYGYHVFFGSLTQEQLTYLDYNNMVTTVQGVGYEIVSIADTGISSISPRYDVCLLLLGDSVKETWQSFLRIHIPALGRMNGNKTPQYLLTPRYDFDVNGLERGVVRLLLLAGIACLSLMLTALSCFLRTRHSGWIYGMYTMLGARFKKLYEISLWELALLVLPAYCIAFPLAAVMAGGYFVPLGHSLRLHTVSFFAVIPYLAAVVALPPLLPMKKVAQTYPSTARMPGITRMRGIAGMP